MFRVERFHFWSACFFASIIFLRPGFSEKHGGYPNISDPRVGDRGNFFLLFPKLTPSLGYKLPGILGFGVAAEPREGGGVIGAVRYSLQAVLQQKCTNRAVGQ